VIATGWTTATRLLCVRLDTMGDVLMTTPAMKALKASRPDRSITLLTSARGAAVAALVPEIDDVIVYDAPWMKATQRRDNRRDHGMVEHLSARGFEAAVIFTVYSQSPLASAFLCFLAGIPLRLAHCRENPYELLTDWVKDPEPRSGVRHEVRRQLDLVAAVGSRTHDESMSLDVPGGARRRALELLAQAGIDSERPWVALHPGASAPSRRYSPEGFAAVARRLVVEAGLQVVLTGAPDEEDLTEYIRAKTRAPLGSVAGRAGVPVLCALLSRASLLISNNTGPVHIAAALGTPVVDLYALTNPQHTPWGVAHRVLCHDVSCKWCYASVCPEGHHNCLAKVSPDDVYEAACELLAETSSGVGLRTSVSRQ
jgi:lipopolysaccharide heptosyltransferase II